MTSFDYLRSARPEALERLLSFRLPPQLHASCAALATAVAFVLAAWVIEAHRLSGAVSLQATYQQRFERSQAEVARANVYYKRVGDLVSLDVRVRQILASGNAAGRQLAEIGNTVPSNAWLTSITRAGTDLRIEGDAQDLTVVARMLQSLTNARSISNPTLIKAERHDAGPIGTSYALDLQSLER